MEWQACVLAPSIVDIPLLSDVAEGREHIKRKMFPMSFAYGYTISGPNTDTLYMLEKKENGTIWVNYTKPLIDSVVVGPLVAPDAVLTLLDPIFNNKPKLEMCSDVVQGNIAKLRHLPEKTVTTMAQALTLVYLDSNRPQYRDLNSLRIDNEQLVQWIQNEASSHVKSVPSSSNQIAHRAKFKDDLGVELFKKNMYVQTRALGNVSVWSCSPGVQVSPYKIENIPLDNDTGPLGMWETFKIFRTPSFSRARWLAGVKLHHHIDICSREVDREKIVQWLAQGNWNEIHGMIMFSTFIQTFGLLFRTDVSVPWLKEMLLNCCVILILLANIKAHQKPYLNVMSLLPKTMTVFPNKRKLALLRKYMNYAPNSNADPPKTDFKAYVEVTPPNVISDPLALNPGATIGHNVTAEQTIESAGKAVIPDIPATGMVSLAMIPDSIWQYRYACWCSESINHQAVFIATAGVISLDAGITEFPSPKIIISALGIIPNYYLPRDDPVPEKIDDLGEINRWMDLTYAIESGVPIDDLLKPDIILLLPQQLIGMRDASFGEEKDDAELKPSGALVSSVSMWNAKLEEMHKIWQSVVPEQMLNASISAFLIGAGFLAALGIQVPSEQLETWKQKKLAVFKSQGLSRALEMAILLLQPDNILRENSKMQDAMASLINQLARKINILSSFVPDEVVQMTQSAWNMFKKKQRPLREQLPYPFTTVGFWMANLAGLRLAPIPLSNPESVLGNLDTPRVTPLVNCKGLPRKLQNLIVNDEADGDVQILTDWRGSMKVTRKKSTWTLDVSLQTMKQAVWANMGIPLSSWNSGEYTYLGELEEVLIQHSNQNLHYQNQTFILVCDNSSSTVNPKVPKTYGHFLPWVQDILTAAVFLLYSESRGSFYLLLITGTSPLPLKHAVRPFGPSVALSKSSEPRGPTLLTFRGCGHVPVASAAGMQHLAHEVNESGSPRLVERMTPLLAPGLFPFCYNSPLRTAREKHAKDLEIFPEATLERQYRCSDLIRLHGKEDEKDDDKIVPQIMQALVELEASNDPSSLNNLFTEQCHIVQDWIADTSRRQYDVLGSLYEMGPEELIRAWQLAFVMRVKEQAASPWKTWSQIEKDRLKPSLLSARSDTRAPYVVAFEAATGQFLSTAQQKTLSSWQDHWFAEEKESMIVRSIMGSGKSAVLTPLLILYAVIEKNSNVTLILPEHLVPQALNVMASSVLQVLSARQLLLYSGANNPPPEDLTTCWLWILSDSDAKKVLLDRASDPSIDNESVWPWKSALLFDEIDSMFNAFRSNYNIPSERVVHFCEPVRSETRAQAAYFSACTKLGFDSNADIKSEQTHISTPIAQRLCSVAKMNLRWNVNFGLTVKKTSRMLAVPFRFADVPDESSSFSDVDLTAILSARTRARAGWQLRDMVPLQQLIIQHLKEGSEEILKLMLSDQGVSMSRLANLTPVELQAQLEVLDVEKRLLRHYIKMALLPDFLEAHAKRKNVSFLDLMTTFVATNRLGFSGTRRIYVPRNNYLCWNNAEVAKPNASDTDIQNVISRSEVYQLEENKEDLLDTILNMAKQHNADVIIDESAFLADYQANNVASIWLKADKRANSVVYFDRNTHVPMEVGRDHVSNRYRYQVGKNVRVFFDQQHTVGTDIRLDPHARALTLIKPQSRFTEVAQAVYRLREVQSGAQTNIFLIAAEVDKGSDLLKILNNNEQRYFDSMKESPLKLQLDALNLRAAAYKKSKKKRVDVYTQDTPFRCKEDEHEVKKDTGEADVEQNVEEELEQREELETFVDEMLEETPSRLYWSCFNREGGNPGSMLYAMKPSAQFEQLFPGEQKRPRSACIWKDLGIIMSSGVLQYWSLRKPRADVPLVIVIYENEPEFVQIATAAEIMWVTKLVEKEHLRGISFHKRHDPVSGAVHKVARLLVGSTLTIREQFELLWSLSDKKGDLLLKALDCVSHSNAIYPAFSARFVNQWYKMRDYPKHFVCKMVEPFTQSGEKFITDILGWPEDFKLGKNVWDFLQTNVVPAIQADGCGKKRRAEVTTQRQRMFLALGLAGTLVAAGGGAWAYKKGLPKMPARVKTPGQAQIQALVDSPVLAARVEPKLIAIDLQSKTSALAYLPETLETIGIISTNFNNTVTTAAGSAFAGSMIITDLALQVRINNEDKFLSPQAIRYIESMARTGYKVASKSFDVARVASILEQMTPSMTIFTATRQPMTLVARPDVRRGFKFLINVPGFPEVEAKPNKMIGFRRWEFKLHSEGKTWTFAVPLQSSSAESDVAIVRRVRSSWTKLRLGPATLMLEDELSKMQVFYALLNIYNNRGQGKSRMMQWMTLASKLLPSVVRKFNQEVYTVEPKETDAPISWEGLAMLTRVCLTLVEINLFMFM